MANVIFYEKPGCSGNARQKAMLEAAGHRVDSRNILNEPWTADRLKMFFGGKPVSQWFNQNSPRIKSGEINPSILDGSTALTLMLTDPLLIRRPLMVVGSSYESGFDADRIHAWIGLHTAEKPNLPQDLELCRKR